MAFFLAFLILAFALGPANPLEHNPVCKALLVDNGIEVRVITTYQERDNIMATYRSEIDEIVLYPLSRNYRSIALAHECVHAYLYHTDGPVDDEHFVHYLDSIFAEWYGWQFKPYSGYSDYLDNGLPGNLEAPLTDILDALDIKFVVNR